MTDRPTPEDVALWQRRLASLANNRAWALAETSPRTPDEDEEMLHAAHAAMYFWKIVGKPGHHAHAALLLAHVYALLGLPNPAAHYLGKSLPWFLQNDCAPSELAFAHAIAANVASTERNAEAHAEHYAQAQAAAAQVTNPEERRIFEDTLRVIPKPGA
ncbi:MAG TPA: hypothetical protein VJ722_09265 [Rhodanobacteraceae bacterium]|nr:hypothetical protein [Rhodanobacteraceae bacterium]